MRFGNKRRVKSGNAGRIRTDRPDPASFSLRRSALRFILDEIT